MFECVGLLFCLYELLFVVCVCYGVQEQPIGLKKCSRLLTWEKIFFDALAINLWQKLKNRLGNRELIVK